MDSLYRIRPESEEFRFKPQTAGNLANSYFSFQPAAEPESPCIRCGEWYCEAEDCPVRQFWVFTKYETPRQTKRSPTINCPHCKHPAKFHHWLKEIQLEPASTEVANA